jgi:ribosome-binding ATPase YchF (GTP1/OBG family)
LLTIAIVGKTNVGKTTLFNAATLLDAKMSNYSFTTTEPNLGTAYVSDICVCRELGVKDNPQESICIDGWRYIPIKIIDVPGLIKDAWKGRGLGNKFLSAIGQADALIHVVDASGSVDDEGKITKPGAGNPLQDVFDIESEIEKWISDIVSSNKQLIVREAAHLPLEEAISLAIAGIKAKLPAIKEAIKIAELENVNIENWGELDIMRFVRELLPLTKPSMIVANKMDLYLAEENYEKLSRYFSNGLVTACSAEAELVLRRAQKTGLLRYTPGSEKFTLVKGANLTSEQARAIEYVDKRVMAKWMRTGIQQALNVIVFKLLKMNMIYPVANESTFSDNHGHVLPHAHLLADGSTPIDLAGEVHSRLVEQYILALDAKTGLRLPKDYKLRHRDVIKIMTQPRVKKN